jgi:hypothetical protein
MSTSEREDAKALLELKEGGPEPQSKKQKITRERVADVFGDCRDFQKIVVPAFWQGMDGHTTQVILATVLQLQADGFSYTETLPPPARGDVYTRPMTVYYGKLAVSLNGKRQEAFKQFTRETTEEAARASVAAAAMNEAAKK